MVQFGCCLPTASFVPQIDKKEKEKPDIVKQISQGLKVLEQSGYDFCELTVGSITNLSKDDLYKVKDIIKSSSVKVPVFNSFVPPSIPLTGFEVSKDTITEYLKVAIKRVSDVGGKYIIFGSGGARNVPEYSSMTQGRKQIIDFLRICEKYGDKYDVTIAIEPLNGKETNIINKVEDALNLAKALKLPHIKVLADSYHMYMENESFDILYDAPELVHVHIADKKRKYPGVQIEDGVDFKSLFKTLKDINYQGGISAECKFDDFESECGKSLDFVKKTWDNI